MTDRFNRREVLKGLGIGAIAVSAVGPVTATSGERFIVTTRGNGVRNRIERAGFTVVRELADGDVLLVEGPGDRDDLEDLSGVRAAVEDYQFRWDGPVERAESEETTDDVLFPLQWDKQVTDVPEAHETATGAGTTIAIIDTGTDVDGHPDLPNVDASEGRLFSNGEVRSGTGDVEFPADVADLCAGTTTITDHVADDVYYHGTHVAGIAGASREGTTGVVGTAPDTDIVPLRVFWWDEFDDDCDDDDEVEEDAAALTTTTVDILSAIDYASEIGVDAMNMSFGTLPLPPQVNRTGIRVAYERVIQRATQRGSVVVVSAGNDSANLQQGGFFTVPNSTAGAMSISATGPNDELAHYSNFGTNEIDVGAPGGGYETVEKTLDPGADVEWPFPTNFVLNAADPDSYVGQLFGGVEYLYVIGTSMAAPQVTGAAALVREVAPDSTPRQVEEAIEHGADLGQGQSDSELGAGRLNAADALDAPVITDE
jgi:subtilisin family serine protease